MDTKQLANPIPKGYCRFCPAFNKKPANTFKVVDAVGGYAVRYCTQCGVGLHVTDAEGRVIYKNKNAIAQIAPPSTGT